MSKYRIIQDSNDKYICEEYTYGVSSSQGAWITMTDYEDWVTVFHIPIKAIFDSCHKAQDFIDEQIKKDIDAQEHARQEQEYVKVVKVIQEYI